MNTSISAIILAAGTSSRMGSPKQLLPLGNRTILEHVIRRSLEEDFSEIIIVIGHEAKTIKKEINVDDRRIRWVVNEEYQSGQSSSLKLGIERLEFHSNIMVFLGDLPFISAETIRLIYKAGLNRMKEDEGAFIIRPSYNGVSGHPVFFGNVEKQLFQKVHGDKGAKTIMNEIPNHILIEVADQGVLFDVDTPEDYAKAKEIVNM